MRKRGPLTVELLNKEITLRQEIKKQTSLK